MSEKPWLDIIAAFHKIRVAEGEEWKTAFRTRYGLFEWLVTPFGLTGAPAIFQRYINWVLREYLDEFCSAYIDDILIFSSGSLTDHRDKVKKVLQRLREAGLQLDVVKCEFKVKTVRYLGFVIEAGIGITMEPEKVKAIIEWEAPHSTCGIRAFVGFANYYRRFIYNFSVLVAPLTELTKKGTPFKWGPEAQRAFEKLKVMFVTAPILAQFDPEKETILEADSSGWSVGGVLSQYDEKGELHPCAYFSKKNSPAECNYEIHDKELLAIIRCPEEWDAELRSVKDFTILTDHKNLEYFMKVRQLTERQVRWSLILSRYKFKLMFRPGKLAGKPDALSRREQDIPKDASDERLQHRVAQLLKPEVLPTAESSLHVALVNLQPPKPDEERPLIEDLWMTALEQDKSFEEIKDAIERGDRRFPTPPNRHNSNTTYL